MKEMIDGKKFESKDAFGVPVLAFKDAIQGQVEIGLGPLRCPTMLSVS